MKYNKERTAIFWDDVKNVFEIHVPEAGITNQELEHEIGHAEDAFKRIKAGKDPYRAMGKNSISRLFDNLTGKLLQDEKVAWEGLKDTKLKETALRTYKLSRLSIIPIGLMVAGSGLMLIDKLKNKRD